MPLVSASAESNNAGGRMLTVNRHRPAFTDNFHVIPQSRPCSANDNICVPPTIRWSSTRISTSISACNSR
ncbi:hypothetical protein FMJ37_27520 [Klebsiella michiganensis]|nr:hypothetical protein [Klebsiella michiganensis]